MTATATRCRSSGSSKALGVDLVRRLPGRVPGLYTISVDERGERTFTYWRDSSAARSYFDEPDTPLERAAGSLDALYFSGISLAILNDNARERLFGAAQRVRAHGGRVIFDNNYRPPSVARCGHRANCLRAGIGTVECGPGDAGR